MSDLHFFMTNSDTEEFVTWLIAQFEPTFIPSWHPTAEFPTLRTLAEISRYIADSRHTRQFFLLSDVWQLHPLCFDQIRHNDGTSAFYVAQRYGGPAFDFVLSRQHTDPPGIIVGGRFGDYSSYYIRSGSPDWLRRPAGMSEAFRAAQKYIRGLGRRTVSAELGHSGGWALPGALAAHASGTWLRRGDFHFHPSVSAKPRSA